jgi:hypothetical protein
MFQRIRLWHLVYWVIFVSVFTVVYASYDGRYLGTLSLNLIRLPFMVLISFLLFSAESRMSTFSQLAKVSAFLFLLVSAVLVSRFLFGQWVFPHFFSGDYTFNFWNASALFNQTLVIAAGVSGFGTVTYLIEKSKWNANRIRLAEEKRMAELNFYKAQVHPHFLFNTLNGIYSESLKKSKTVPDLILKLSELLRFMLYECDKPLIPLSNELKVIRNYVELEELRYGKRLNVKMKLPDANEISAYTISPLIFLGFVENAFKHGVSAQLKDSFIEIEVALNKGLASLIVINSKFENTPDSLGSKKGIGLENIKAQLDLIYPDRYTLIQNEKGNAFVTQLKIPLSE